MNKIHSITENVKYLGLYFDVKMEFYGLLNKNTVFTNFHVNLEGFPEEIEHILDSDIYFQIIDCAIIKVFCSIED